MQGIFTLLVFLEMPLCGQKLTAARANETLGGELDLIVGSFVLPFEFRPRLPHRLSQAIPLSALQVIVNPFNFTLFAPFKIGFESSDRFRFLETRNRLQLNLDVSQWPQTFENLLDAAPDGFNFRFSFLVAAQ